MNKHLAFSLLLLFPLLSGCFGPSFGEFQKTYKPHISRIDIRLGGEEVTSVRPTNGSFPRLAEEVLRVTFEIEGPERLRITPNQTEDIRNRSEYVEAVLSRSVRVDLPQYDEEPPKADAILAVFSSQSDENLAGKLLLCLDDYCTPHRTAANLRSLRSTAEQVS